MTDNITTLELAQSPAKDKMIEILDGLKNNVKIDAVIHIVTIQVFTNGRFDVMADGGLKMTEVAGMLGRAHLDALNAL